MKIRTAYNHYSCNDYEILECNRITDGGQFMSITEMVQRTIRGESLDVHNYGEDNWLNAVDKFDVMDAYIAAENREAAAAAAPPVSEPVTPASPDSASATPPSEA